MKNLIAWLLTSLFLLLSSLSKGSNIFEQKLKKDTSEACYSSVLKDKGNLNNGELIKKMR